jgi:predicted secreted protein
MRGLLPIIVVSVVLGSCAHLRGPAAPPTLGPSDTGKSIELAVGQTVTVRLASSPGTGYLWQTATEPDERVLIVVDAGYDRPVPDAPAAPGQAWWKLRATGVGSTSIALRYVRPWESSEGAGQFTLTVTVK